MSDTSDATASPSKAKKSSSAKSAASKADKAQSAFRTISEVSEDLDIPQHVLRFWETKFSQVKPTKRAGGRRYYRPQDIELLRQIKRLLHDDGLTIKGVQKVLKSARGVSSAIEKAKEAGVGQVAETVAADTANSSEQTESKAAPSDAASPAPKADNTSTDDAPPSIQTASVVQLPRSNPSGASAAPVSQKAVATEQKKAMPEPVSDPVSTPTPTPAPATASAPEIAMLHGALEKALGEFKSLRREIDELLQSLPSTSS